jgi:hypothetical protein
MIPGTNGTYEVSDAGRARGPRGLLSPTLTSNGYRKIGIALDGRRVQRRLHRLVAAAFVDGHQPELDACHINGDKADNRAENLKWGTRSENIRDQVRHGTHRSSARTHCTYGHPLDASNVTYAKGYRSCATCLEHRRITRAEKRRLKKVREQS